MPVDTWFVIGFVVYAVFADIDKKLISFSEKKCLKIRLIST